MVLTTEAATLRRRRPGRIRRALIGLAVAVAALLTLAILWGALAPLPSTLMLWRMIRGESVERTWTPLPAISPHLRRAVIAAEDQRFCRHRGIDWGALREVLQDEDGPSRGASTIAMQTAKNVFLWHGRSAIRKGLELPLALVIDAAWGKERVLEVYLNVAEFGEGLFGAEAAARRYFGRSASELGPREAAQLAAALPNPRLRNPFRPSVRARANASRIVQRMAELGPRADCVLAAGGKAGEAAR